MRNAEIAQLVEHQLPKLRAAGSNPVFRSKITTRMRHRSCDAFFIHGHLGCLHPKMEGYKKGKGSNAALPHPQYSF